jgi:hypothetical protein
VVVVAVAEGHNGRRVDFVCLFVVFQNCF